MKGDRIPHLLSPFLWHFDTEMGFIHRPHLCKHSGRNVSLPRTDCPRLKNQGAFLYDNCLLRHMWWMMPT